MTLRAAPLCPQFSVFTNEPHSEDKDVSHQTLSTPPLLHSSAVFSSVRSPIICAAHLSSGFSLSASTTTTTSPLSIPLFSPTRSHFFPLGQLQTPRLGFTSRPPPSAEPLSCHPFLPPPASPSPPPPPCLSALLSPPRFTLSRLPGAFHLTPRQRPG